jgi:hypothetical protein
MTRGSGRWLRDNAFLVAAVALPVVVAGFFILATTIPRWTVPPPAHDLVLRVARPYDAAPATLTLEFTVRDGQVLAVLRPVPTPGYVQPWALMLYEHESGRVREVPFDPPDGLLEGETSRTVPIEALAGRRVSSQAAAPDGYELQTRTTGGPGLVGDLFGMGRYRQNAALVRDGRVVPLDLPAPYQNPYQSPVYAVGWVIDGTS